MKGSRVSLLSFTAIAEDCLGLYNAGIRNDGVYTMRSYPVYCDLNTDGGGWTVFQRRRDGSQDFHQDWNAYKAGFGQLTGEFWLGLDKIHGLTHESQCELRVELEDWTGTRVHAKYRMFVVGDENEQYRLTVALYSDGRAGDSLDYHNNMNFTTKDRDHDEWPGNCADRATGGWWFRGCTAANLNGRYLGNVKDDTGVKWWHWHSNYLSMKFAEMKLRPVSYV